MISKSFYHDAWILNIFGRKYILLDGKTVYYWKHHGFKTIIRRWFTWASWRDLDQITTTLKVKRFIYNKFGLKYIFGDNGLT